MAIKKHLSNQDEQDEDILKDGESLRTPLMMMDSVQRSIYEQSRTEAAVKATHDAMQARSEASRHRPGYRLSVKMTTDAAARDALQDVYDQYEKDLCARYLTAAPGPISITTDDLLDSNFDDSADPYEAYDRCISQAWRGT